MPPFGSWPGASPSSAIGGTHAKTPELPAGFKWRHSITSSKLVNWSRVRSTPMGTPVDRRRSPSHFQVSASPLTAAKLSGPSARQPGPVPSTKARGRADGSCAGG